MRYVISVVCIALILAIGFLKDFEFGTYSIILFAIAALVLLVKDLPEIIKRVRRFKFSKQGLEIEVEALANETKELEKAKIISEKPKKKERPYPSLVEEEVEEYRYIIDKVPPSAIKLIALSVAIEKRIKELAQSVDILRKYKKFYIKRVFVDLALKEVVPGDIVPLFMDFWTIRNKITHSEFAELPERSMRELVGIGDKILVTLDNVVVPDKLG